MSITKTYYIRDNEYILDFIGLNIDDLIISDVSPFKQGLDDFTTDDNSVYPGNVELITDDKNFDTFKNLYSSYNTSYPFNYESIFYLLIKKNGTARFKGYLESIYHDEASHTLKLRFTDGINKTKNVTLGNPYFLSYLAGKGIIKKRQADLSATCSPVYVYGFGGRGSFTPGDDTGFTRSATFTPDEIFLPGINYDSDYKLKDLIAELFKVLSPDITVEFDSKIKFKSRAPQNIEAELDEIYIRYILSNLFGRFIAATKNGGGSTFNITDIKNNGNSDYNTFDLVFEDDNYRVWYHNWRGPRVYTDPAGNTTIRNFNRGLGGIKLSELLKYLAKNLFAKFEFKAPGVISWQHKAISTVAGLIPIPYIIEYAEETQSTRVSAVKINDTETNFNGNAGSAGVNNDLDDTQKIEFSIPFTCVERPYDEEDRLYFFHTGDSPGTTKVTVAKIIDTQIFFQVFPVINEDFIQKQIATSEYYKQFTGTDKKLKIKYTLRVPGTDYNLSERYTCVYKGQTKNVKPIEVERYEINDDTNLQGTSKIICVDAPVHS